MLIENIILKLYILFSYLIFTILANNSSKKIDKNMNNYNKITSLI